MSINKYVKAVCIFAVALVLCLGIMASNGWLPSTDQLSGTRTGWFGRPLPKNAASGWNPFPSPLTSPTPQLSKENIYAGSRLLSVVDSNSQEVPPADLAVWRPDTNSAWYVMGPGGTIATSAFWGTTGDIPQLGDFDGDGKTDFCVFRPATSMWYTIYSGNNGTGGGAFGSSGDIPTAADFDGDGKKDIAVYRPSTGYWYWLKSSDANAAQYAAFGLSTDLPIPADYDGDGKADISVWRPSNHTFYTLRSSDNSLQSASFGATGDVPVPGDYDGDGKANYALRSGASWLILRSDMSTVDPTTPAGDLSTDTPVPNDYDGDGKCDIAVWRDSNGDWYIRNSGSGGALRHEHWGQHLDIPVPAYFRR